MKQIGRWLQRFVTAILVAVILMNGILLVKRFVYHEELPSLFGYSMVTVLSGSMEPAFSPGDSLIREHLSPIGFWKKMEKPFRPRAMPTTRRTV